MLVILHVWLILKRLINQTIKLCGHNLVCCGHNTSVPPYLHLPLPISCFCTYETFDNNEQKLLKMDEKITFTNNYFLNWRCIVVFKLTICSILPRIQWKYRHYKYRSNNKPEIDTITKRRTRFVYLAVNLNLSHKIKK